MARVQAPLFGPGTTGRGFTVGSPRLLNIYPTINEDAKANPVYYGCPGKRLVGSLGTGKPIRGAISDGLSAIIVSGDGVYKMAASEAFTRVGTMETATGRVWMAENGTQTLITDGFGGYICEAGATAKVEAAGFPGAGPVAFQDGYFIAVRPGSQVFGVSGLYDGETWDGADIASAEGLPDDLVTVASLHREVWLFGERSVEVWYNSGGAAFPFERRGDVYLEVGCPAAHSVAKLDNSIFWLGRNRSGGGQVFRANGYTPELVSTREVDQRLSGKRLDDAFAWAYIQEGQAFYVLTLPSEDLTLAYDAATGAWHERKSWGMGRDRTEAHWTIEGRHYVGDVQGRVLELSMDTYTDAGQPIEREADSRVVSSSGKRLFFSRLEVDLETGVGLNDGQGDDPQVALSISRDAGRTWNSERFRSMGKMGKYRSRVSWSRLGSARDMAFRVRTTEPVKFVMLGSWVDMAEGVS